MSFDIYNFDLYIFDLDGTVIDSEKFHYMSYQKAIQAQSVLENTQPILFSWQLYQKYAHSVNDRITLRNYIEMHNLNFDKVYELKEQYFVEMAPEIAFISGFPEFLRQLFLRNKKVCIATNSSVARCNAIKKQLPLLNQIGLWITKDLIKNKKPHPEMLSRAINAYGRISMDKVIMFDDSYVGYTAMMEYPCQKVIITTPEYFYYDNIINDSRNTGQSNVIQMVDYNQLTFKKNNNLTKTQESQSLDFYDLYINQLQKVKADIEYTANTLTPLILNCKGRIYFFGIGKSGNVCQKAVSNLRSYGIQAFHITTNELFHGDFGIIHTNDLIVYLTKSGNTFELVQTAEYIQKHFKTLQVVISNNAECKLAEIVDFNFVLGTKSMIEADHINMAPTVSSTIIMITLDRLCVEVCKRRNVTKHQFLEHHPGGNLGQTPTYIDYIVCVAGGKSTRLHPYTKYIPKLLLNTDENVVVYKMIKYWSTYCKHFVFIVDSEHKDLLDYYLKVYTNTMDSEVTYDIQCYDKTNGTAATVFTSLNNSKYLGKNLLITWSDIYPTVTIKKKIFKNNRIFLYGSECRYNHSFYDGPPIIKNVGAGGGNVIGIYFMRDFQIMKYTEPEDLVDVISREQQYSDYTIYPYEIAVFEGLVDVGDSVKYQNECRKNNRTFDCRSFNRICYACGDGSGDSSGDGGIHKESINTKGDAIISREMNWYRFTENKKYIPRVLVYNKNSFLMTEIENSKPLYKTFFTFDIQKQFRILDDIITKLNDLHSDTITVNSSIIDDDFKIEFFTKIQDRCWKILPIVSKLENIYKIENVKTINGIQLNNSPSCFLIDSINSMLTNCFENHINNGIYHARGFGLYELIHGDCQFSNTLYNDSTGSVSFIDPRGYFGNTFVYGYDGYDFGKVAYALSGYDSFNNQQNLFSLNINDSNIQIDVPEKFDETISYLSLKTGKNFDKLIAMMCINWLGLAEYFSNNPLKSMGAIVYAQYYYHKYLISLKPTRSF